MGADPGLRSPVSTAIAFVTPAMSFTAVSAAERSGSNSRARSAGTVMENITLPPSM